MLTFPQLSSASVAQYPARKRQKRRCARTETPGGHVEALYDPAGSGWRWELSFTEMTEEEKSALETLFVACDGRLERFLFLDPFANLLGWTEQWDHAAWSRDGGVTVSGGVADPRGGSGAATLSNGSQADSGVSQSLAVPSTFTYCLSAWMRGAEGAATALAIDGTRRSFSLTSEWRQYWVTAQAGGGDLVRFAMEVDAGGSVDLYGPQAEPQLGPSAYKRNDGRGGWYPRARFDQDTLDLTAGGPEQYSAVVRVVSPLEE
jgi:hypothetical protein